jgi:hypothetical protein
MRKVILFVVAIVAASPSQAQRVSATLPTICNPNNTADCIRATPVTNPDGTNIGGGGGGGSTPTGSAGAPSASVVTVQGITNGTPQNVTVTNNTYPLATNGTSVGSVSPVAGSYVLNLPATFGGATITFSATSSNGTVTTATYTSAPASPPRFDIYAGTTVSVAIAGGTPTGTTTLSGGPANGISSPLGTYQTYQATGPTAVTTTVSTTTQTDSAAFAPQLGRPINLLLTGTWAGTVQLLRSIDGGATRLPVTYIDGSTKGSFTVDAQTLVATESEGAATYYLRFTLTSGSATGRLS